MEIRQLRTLIAVVETNSFTKAAEKLFLSQPTVSAHIRVLEEELKTQLIVRSTKSIKVTQKGMELYETAKHIISMENKLYEKWQNSDREIIHIGASTIPSGYILPEIIPQFLKKSADSHFIIDHGDSSEILDGLENGLFDIGFVGMAPKNDLVKYVPFCKDNMVLVTPNTEQYTKYLKDNEIPLEDLKKFTYVFREEGSASWRAGQKVLNTLGLNENKIKVTARLNDQESIKNFVSAGMGVSIISDKAVVNAVAQKRLLMFDLPVESSRTFYIATRKNITLCKTATSFIGYVQRFYNLEQSRR